MRWKEQDLQEQKNRVVHGLNGSLNASVSAISLCHNE